MSKPLKDIIDILSDNKIGLSAYVGKNYTKKNLIDDLYALRANYPYSRNDLLNQMEVDIEIKIKKKIKLSRSDKRMRKVNRIIKRDGINCFYCDIPMERHEMTIEHFEPKSKGGNGHICNLRVAHKECNGKAGSMDVKEKLLLRANLAASHIKISD